MASLSTAQFCTTVTDLRRLPAPVGPEVAFVGRSNAGKSTAINALCRRRKLAFASRTPGRTQALNLFDLAAAGDAPPGRLVDTPGYGYAAVPQATRESWGRLAGRYVAGRDALGGVVLVADIRRGLTALDEELLAWAPARVHLLVLLAKADKLNRDERRRATLAMEQALGLRGRDDGHALAFSALSGEGVDEARARIEAWLA